MNNQIWVEFESSDAELRDALRSPDLKIVRSAAFILTETERRPARFEDILIDLVNGGDKVVMCRIVEYIRQTGSVELMLNIVGRPFPTEFMVKRQYLVSLWWADRLQFHSVADQIAANVVDSGWLRALEIVRSLRNQEVAFDLTPLDDDEEIMFGEFRERHEAWLRTRQRSKVVLEWKRGLRERRRSAERKLKEGNR